MKYMFLAIFSFFILAIPGLGSEWDVLPMEIRGLIGDELELREFLNLFSTSKKMSEDHRMLLTDRIREEGYFEIDATNSKDLSMLTSLNSRMTKAALTVDIRNTDNGWINNFLGSFYIYNIQRLIFCATDENVKMLVKAYLPNLTDLVFDGNKIGANGFRALAKSNLPTMLRFFAIRSTHITSKGAMELAKIDFINLTCLDLRHSDIGVLGFRTLAKSHLRNLTKLILLDIKIGDEGAMALAEGDLPKLTYLYLWDNGIGDQGAIALVESHLMLKLTDLTLGENDISDVGAMAVAKAGFPNLTHLDLSWNKIGKEGVIALINAKFPNLTDLKVDRWSCLDDKAIQEIRKRFQAE